MDGFFDSSFYVGGTVSKNRAPHTGTCNLHTLGSHTINEVTQPDWVSKTAVK
jgi:hypothetical protein